MGFKDLEKLVKSYDKGIEYKNTTYATLFGPVYVDTVSGTKEGRLRWTSEDKSLLNLINKEVFKNLGLIIQWKEGEPQWMLIVDKEKIIDKIL